MLANEVRSYTESYMYLWKHRENYQEFRFNVMNMLVDSAYDQTIANQSTKEAKP